MASTRTERRRPRWHRRPDERPKALMASALKLLKRRGYRRVSLDEIAADAGVSKATVYHYFANKDDLLTRSVAERIAGRHAALERTLASARGSVAGQLRAFLRDYWRFSITRQAGMWQRLLVSEIVTEAPEIFTVWAHGLVQRWGYVAQLIRSGQEAGEFRAAVDPEAAARMIISALSHQALFHVHFGVRRLAPYDLDRLFDAFVDQLLNGICARPRRASRRR